MLDAEGARVIAEHQAFAVPTLAIIDAIRDLGPALGLTAGMIDKAREVSDHALHSIELLKAAGANIGFGTDLLGITQPRQSSEFRLRREVLSAVEILRSATSVNAALLNKTGEVGAVVPGAFADLLVIDGNPLDDVTVLEQHDRIQAILKEGRFYKNSLPA